MLQITFIMNKNFLRWVGEEEQQQNTPAPPLKSQERKGVVGLGAQLKGWLPFQQNQHLPPARRCSALVCEPSPRTAEPPGGSLSS